MTTFNYDGKINMTALCGWNNLTYVTDDYGNPVATPFNTKMNAALFLMENLH